MKLTRLSLLFILLIAAPRSFGEDIALNNADVWFETGRLSQYLVVEQVRYYSALSVYHLRRADLLQDKREDIQAADAAKHAVDLAPQDGMAHVLYANALLRTLNVGRAIAEAQAARALGVGDDASIAEAFALQGLATTVFMEVQGGKRSEVRPEGLPGQGPITEQERDQWLQKAMSLLDPVLHNPGRPPLADYVAGLVRWEQADRGKDPQARTDAAAHFEDFLKRVPAYHHNYLRRQFAAERVNTVTPGRVDTSPFTPELRYYALWTHNRTPADVVIYHVLVLANVNKISLVELSADFFDGTANLTLAADTPAAAAEKLARDLEDGGKSGWNASPGKSAIKLSPAKADATTTAALPRLSETYEQNKLWLQLQADEHATHDMKKDLRDLAAASGVVGLDVVLGAKQSFRLFDTQTWTVKGEMQPYTALALDRFAQRLSALDPTFAIGSINVKLKGTNAQFSLELVHLIPFQPDKRGASADLRE